MFDVIIEDYYVFYKFLDKYVIDMNLDKVEVLDLDFDYKFIRFMCIRVV